jgi:predicted oxidoreductase (fatty acid repression mutant protein)
LKEKEAQYMRVLADEWKRRDKEREMVVKKKVRKTPCTFNSFSLVLYNE